MLKLKEKLGYFSKGEIALWILASMHDVRYISVVVCFVAFLVNDIYGYLSWQKMKKRQADTNEADLF